ncbi:MAG: T9SS type A sorting domain-containing protein [Bacteroidetes bacterium]|nr:T9SS type A sorting domain-containing protein [Bacteroidota bacterium]
MKRFLSLTAFFFLFASLSAQHEWDQWRFGDSCAMSFTGGAPVNVPPCSMSSDTLFFPWMGYASIADRNGNLLFYTNSRVVWDRTCTITPNGSGLRASQCDNYQGSLIVPVPGDTNLYYIFNSTCGYSQNLTYDTGYYYSIFDRRLHGGLGDLTSAKNVLLYRHNSGLLTATHNAAHTGIWIVTHLYNSDMFASYLLTSAGLSAPVYSRAGDSTFFITYHQGFSVAAFSMDGRRLATPLSRNSGQFQLFDFDPVTGIVSGAVLVSPVNTGQQTEMSFTCFSPDGNHLYAIENAFGQVWQFDVTSHSPTDIWNSRYVVHNAHWSSTYAGIQNGPDGKIYIARLDDSYMAVINNPDAAGAACAFADSGYWLGPHTTLGTIGLPNIVFSSFGPPLCQPSTVAVNGALCGDLPYDFHGRQIGSAGTYRDTLASLYGCDSIVELTLRSVVPPRASLPLGPLVQRGVLHVSGTDTFACQGEPDFFMTGGSPPGGVYSGAAITGSRFHFDSVSAGNSAVTYIYTDSNGCAAGAHNTIRVEDCTGVNDLSGTASIALYPQPGSGLLSLHCACGNGNYMLSDVSGRTVAEGQITAEYTTIDVSERAPGTYLLSVRSGRGTATLKVSIDR